jgi:hypothetical protein
MIRYAVATVLLAYFLGANTFAPYRPPVIGDAMRVFHSEINRGTWKIVGPVVLYLRDTFGSDSEPTRRADSATN